MRTTKTPPATEEMKQDEGFTGKTILVSACVAALLGFCGEIGRQAGKELVEYRNRDEELEPQY